MSDPLCDDLVKLVRAACMVVAVHEANCHTNFKLLEPKVQKEARGKFGQSAEIEWLGDPDILALKAAIIALDVETPRT